ncbi:hypothetical protein [Stenotrophomonas maltophilia]|uniref:hypothetical protein n=1 Tax=Stenotrophomonas maltophilia TaxID=40324 RepID=UPI0040549641
MTTDNKTLAVDVLAVMDAATDVFDQENWTPSKIAMEESRAAVAELIEAVGLLTDSANPEIAGWSEAVTALARVKGESA